MLAPLIDPLKDARFPKKFDVVKEIEEPRTRPDLTVPFVTLPETPPWSSTERDREPDPHEQLIAPDQELPASDGSVPRNSIETAATKPPM
jgi:hypothetical protein